MKKKLSSAAKFRRRLAAMRKKANPNPFTSRKKPKEQFFEHDVRCNVDASPSVQERTEDIDPPDSSTNPEQEPNAAVNYPEKPEKNVKPATATRLSSLESSHSDCDREHTNYCEQRMKSAVQEVSTPGGRQRTKSGSMFFRKNRDPPNSYHALAKGSVELMNWNNRKMLLKLQRQLRLQGLCLSTLATMENPDGGCNGKPRRMAEAFGSSGNITKDTTSVGCRCHCACSGALPVTKEAGGIPEQEHATYRDVIAGAGPHNAQLKNRRNRQKQRGRQNSAWFDGTVSQSGHHARQLQQQIHPCSADGDRIQRQSSLSRSSSCDSAASVDRVELTKQYRQGRRASGAASLPCTYFHTYPVDHGTEYRQSTRFQPQLHHNYLHHRHHPHHNHHQPQPQPPHRQHFCISTTTAAATSGAASHTPANVPICMRAMHSVVSVRETHHIAQAQQEKNAKLREAFGISQYFVEGTSFDQDRKAKEDLAKSESVQRELAEKEKAKEMERANRKRYALVRTPSPEKESARSNGSKQQRTAEDEREEGEHEDDGDEDIDANGREGRVASKGATSGTISASARGKDEKKKKKKKARDGSSSPERKKDKKKKSKKNKKERSKKKHSKKSHREDDSDSSDTESDSEDSDVSSDSERDGSNSKRKKKASKKEKKKKSSKKKKAKSRSPSRNKSPAVSHKKAPVEDEKQHDKRRDNYQHGASQNLERNKRHSDRDGRVVRPDSRDRSSHRAREDSRDRGNRGGGPPRSDRYDDKRFSGNHRGGGDYYSRNRDRDQEGGGRMMKDQERRSRSRNRRRERSGDRERKDKSRSRSGSRNRRRERSIDRERKEKSRSRSASCNRHARGRSVEKTTRYKNRRERTPRSAKVSERSQERDAGRDKDRERERERDRERELDRERERKRKVEDDRSRDRERYRDGDQDRGRNRRRSQSSSRKEDGSPSRRRRQGNDSSVAAGHDRKSSSPQPPSRNESKLSSAESKITKKSDTTKKNSPDPSRASTSVSPTQAKKTSSHGQSSSGAPAAANSSDECSSDLSYSPAVRDPERYRDVLQRKKASSSEKEVHDTSNEKKQTTSRSPRRSQKPTSPNAGERRVKKEFEKGSEKSKPSVVVQRRTSVSPRSGNSGRSSSTQHHSAARDRSRSCSRSGNRRSISPRKKESNRRSSPDSRKRRDRAPSSNAPPVDTTSDVSLVKPIKTETSRSRSPEVKKRRQERESHSRKDSPPSKASKLGQTEREVPETRRNEPRSSPEHRNDSRKTKSKKASSSSTTATSSSGVPSSSSAIVQQPVVKLHSPETHTASESDGEDPEHQHNDQERDRDDLDAFLPTYDETHEQEKDLSLLKALKHDLAAKAKQSLEKKKSVSESGAIVGGLLGVGGKSHDAPTIAESRVGENREREIQLLQAKPHQQQQTEAAKASPFSNDATDKQAISGKPDAARERKNSNSGSSSTQMKKDIHEILSTVGACAVAEGSEAAASLAKTTILQAMDSILKEKISGATKDKPSTASSKTTRASTRSSHSRSRSPSRSHKSRSYSSSSSESRSSRSHSRSSSSHSRSSSDRASSRSRSRSSSHSSHTTVRSRTGSRSPSIPRRAGSPSFLDRRRITSARKRPIPYRRPTPSSPSSVSSYHSRGSHSRSRSRSKS
ncbi:serine/arginine repetitive matrix protein 2 isoform X2 [Anopheles coustani]|uniref:serine/arginine repetitive matrix protein 2 isoform X2 n=1 Tax=Anopheles coustani TaxID=139045 RepID=UPI00265AC65D|nr:serine/arginine repetitive matrix protein 2 isoform X2 [Anopheles coustani]